MVENFERHCQLSKQSTSEQIQDVGVKRMLCGEPSKCSVSSVSRFHQKQQRGL